MTYTSSVCCRIISGITSWQTNGKLPVDSTVALATEQWKGFYHNMAALLLNTVIVIVFFFQTKWTGVCSSQVNCKISDIWHLYSELQTSDKKWEMAGFFWQQMQSPLYSSSSLLLHMDLVSKVFTFKKKFLFSFIK